MRCCMVLCCVVLCCVWTEAGLGQMQAAGSRAHRLQAGAGMMDGGRIWWQTGASRLVQLERRALAGVRGAAGGCVSLCVVTGGKRRC